MTITNIENWGLHTIIDLVNCNHDIITNPDEIDLWIIYLVEILDMEPYGNPKIVRFGKDDKAGYTAIQLIQTSNICAHFSEDTNSAFIDIFSCKPYDTDAAIDYCIEVFGGTVKSCHIIQR